MNRFTVWLRLVVGMVLYRVFGQPTASIEESIAGAYYGALALVAHWLANGGWGEKESSNA